LILLFAWQSAATCHDAHLKMRQDATIGALIAASRCSTAAPLATALPPAAASADPSGAGDPSPIGRGTIGVGCLHCASGGCGAAASRPIGGWRVAAVALTAVVAATVGPTAARGNSGASAWRNGHPVRGPPPTGV